MDSDRLLLKISRMWWTSMSLKATSRMTPPMADRGSQAVSGAIKTMMAPRKRAEEILEIGVFAPDS